jgi:hypothetical protein
MSPPENKYQCLTKCELAVKCNVSISTIQNWLNIRYFPQLEKLGYRKDQKILLPPQVKFIVEKLVVIEE